MEHMWDPSNIFIFCNKLIYNFDSELLIVAFAVYTQLKLDELQQDVQLPHKKYFEPNA